MPKLYALWSAPNDEAAFTADYLATHAELCKALPGIQDVVTGVPLPGSPYARVTELVFPTTDALMAALGSAEMGPVMADSGRLQETFANKVDAVIVP